MKFHLLGWSLLLAALPAQGSEREKGMQLYKDGRYPEAVAAFVAALASDGESAELQYNLALANWRAGKLDDADKAVEKYAALAGNARMDLYAGVLGALRFDEAKALEKQADALLAAGGQPAPGAPAAAQPEDPLAVLEQAQQKAVQAKDHFVRGATAATSPELLRNTERTLRYLDDLQKKIDELKKQREQQKKDQEQKDSDQKDDKKDENDKKDEQQKQDQKQDDKKQDDQQKSDEQKSGESKDENSKPSEGKEGDSKPEPKPEPKPGEQKADEQKPDAGKPEPQESPEQKPAAEQPEPKPDDKQPAADQKPRTDAPGEAQEGKELSPEQTQRLSDALQNLDQKLKEYRARAKSGRRAVERDW